MQELSDRAMNRATLARQLLLERSPIEPLDAVTRLVGLQAQVPRDPHLALWSRLDGFDPTQLDGLLESRQVVRSVAIRGTIHLLSAGDCLDLWPLSQPVLERELTSHRDLAPKLRGVDLAPPMAWARQFLAIPRTQPELKTALAERFPELDSAALALACRNRLALVQVPPRGQWGRSHQVTVTTVEAWLGQPLGTGVGLDSVALRYLAAFGPARAADFATWSRLTGLAAVWKRIAPDLVAFRGPKGRELLDLPEAPRPDPDLPAPVRFLPEYDNVLLSHADRSRFVSADVSPLYPAGRLGRGHVLVDGTLQASWIVTDGRLEVLHLPLRAGDLRDVIAEAERLSILLGLDGEPRPLAV